MKFNFKTFYGSKLYFLVPFSFLIFGLAVGNFINESEYIILKDYKYDFFSDLLSHFLVKRSSIEEQKLNAKEAYSLLKKELISPQRLVIAKNILDAQKEEIILNTYKINFQFISNISRYRSKTWRSFGCINPNVSDKIPVQKYWIVENLKNATYKNVQPNKMYQSLMIKKICNEYANFSKQTES